MSDHYILKGHEAVPANLMEWVKWYEIGNRRVADDSVGDIRISTVFLGLNHNYGEGPPILYETMVFGGPHDQEWEERYCTWDEAVAGHAEMIERVSREQKRFERTKDKFRNALKELSEPD